MAGYILVLNLGSSSLKFTLYEISGEMLVLKVSGNAENIANVHRSQIKIKDDLGKTIIKKELRDQKDAIAATFEELEKKGFRRGDIKAVGHRVVHGGEKYSDSVLVDDRVIETIKSLIPIAPLHNPVNLTGITETAEILKGVRQVAVFDTAFHETLPEYAYRYAIPEIWYEKYGVRRYGFHGTSHKYVSRKAAAFLKIDYSRFNAVTAHLGNGCSIAKIENGRSVDTSMGFTPLEGVVMGSRSGDIDPAIIEHVAKRSAAEEGTDLAGEYGKVFEALNKKSGLVALYKTNLMQDISKDALSGNDKAKTVIDIYSYRIAKYLGAYVSTMDRTDAVIFTAGVGENEYLVRKRVLDMLRMFDFRIDSEGNEKGRDERIFAKSEKYGTVAMVVPTDEELIIGYDALYLGYFNKPVPIKYPFEY
jgi:acetate kinase